jgi:hypothetical protein
MAIGDPNLYFSRDTKVYLQQGTNIWEIPVLNGFTFTQATNTSEITLAEMADSTGTSRRGRQMFNDSLAPAEWSFDTYVRPFLVTGTPDRVRAVEEPLWANFLANNSFTAATPAWASALVYSTTALDMNFAASNKTTLGTFDLYFVLGAGKAATANYAASEVTTIYRVQNASVNEVSISFDIDGISTLSWSGMGATLKEVASFDASAAIRLGVDATNNFIRNRLTQLTLTSSVTGSSKTYLVTLTGGTITMTNNLSYLTPEVLGKVNTPLGHVTGARSIGGSFTCYLDEKTNGSIDLFEDLTNATSKTQNQFAMDFFVGGKAAGDAPIAPGLQFKIPTAHLTIPAIDTGDVISASVDFAALPSTIDSTNEVSVIRYAGIAP